MSDLALIGGSGLDRLPGLEILRHEHPETPWGPTSGGLLVGRFADVEITFLARHGPDHGLAPHRINYRANLWALADRGVRRVLAVGAVGGIGAAMTPGRLVIPDQIIDYTWGRAHTFNDAGGAVDHVDFTRPYTPALREALLAGARTAGVAAVDGGTYGVTQGPRLESAAEIERLARDGCDVVGMTGMPEAGLARELDLAYACCAVVANRAAGRGEETITLAAIHRTLAAGMEEVHRVLASTLALLAGAGV